MYFALEPPYEQIWTNREDLRVRLGDALTICWETTHDSHPLLLFLLEETTRWLMLCLHLPGLSYGVVFLKGQLHEKNILMPHEFSWKEKVQPLKKERKRFQLLHVYRNFPVKTQPTNFQLKNPCSFT